MYDAILPSRKSCKKCPDAPFNQPMPSDLPSVKELIPTRDSLLSRLKDWRDDDSWRDFFNTYWKLLHGVALKAGLTEEEAQEVV